MEVKNRLRELITIFNNLMFAPDEVYDDIIFELNGYEGLIVYDIDGRFYQMSYKNDSVWNITLFPYDIYGKRVFNGKEWVEK